MKNQVLSIEQMKHLKELGVDTSKANMSHYVFHQMDYVNDGLVRIGNNAIEVIAVSNSYEIEYDLNEGSPYECVEIYPAFILQDIFEIIPRIIYEEITQRHAHLAIDCTIDKIGISYLVGSYIMLKDYRAVGSSFIESAYIMLCWLAENKYLNQTNDRRTSTNQPPLLPKRSRGGGKVQPDSKEIGETLNETIHLIQK